MSLEQEKLITLVVPQTSANLNVLDNMVAGVEKLHNDIVQFTQSQDASFTSEMFDAQLLTLALANEAPIPNSSDTNNPLPNQGELSPAYMDQNNQNPDQKSANPDQNQNQSGDVQSDVQGISGATPQQEIKEQSQNTTMEQVNALPPAQASLAAYIAIDGHTAFLWYNSDGLPIGVDSVPRDLGIHWAFTGFEPVYIPVILPPVAAAETGPCCADYLNIIVKDTSSSYTHTQVAEINSIANSSFHFLFESFCSENLQEIIFSQTGGGVAGGINDETEQYEVRTTNPDIESFVITVDNSGMCPPIDCANPLTSVDVNILNGNFGLYCVDFFIYGYSGALSAIFYDSLGDPWVLVNNKTDFVLECLCTYESQNTYSAPIVLDLNNKGFELTSASTSSVELNINGQTVQTGWIGPDDGFLTYGYSGHGPMPTKDYILTQDVPGAQTDLQALAILAGQNGGIIDASNPIFNKLGVWQDSNGNGIVDKGEYHTLAQLGIVSISLTESGPAQIVNGNVINGVLTFNYANGTVGKAADVALNYQDVVQSNSSIPGVSNSAASSPASASASAPSSAPVHITAADPAVQSALETHHHHHHSAHG